MTGPIANVISVEKIRAELEKLLDTYLLEKAENKELKDAHGIEYWDSAYRTIHDVATALHISLDPKYDEEEEEELPSEGDTNGATEKLSADNQHAAQ